MIHFIICDDNKVFENEIVNTIHNVMFSDNEDYKIYTFKKCNEKLIDLTNDDNQLKIYILDIDSLNNDAFLIANQIRENDLTGIITFYTNYLDSWTNNILKSKCMFFSILDKENVFDNLSQIISTTLKRRNKKNVLQIKSRNTIYRIDTDSILYIVSEKMDRHISIVTDHEKFYIRGSLVDIANMLDKRFIYSHRSCIVNIERIRILNKSTREIIFDNGTRIDLVSFRAIKDITNKL